MTSREPLHLRSEQEYPVPPFAPEEGVGFFLARARAVKPDFTPEDSVAEICRRVDSLPLAIELAAARVKALSPKQILERLDKRLPVLAGGARDAPDRQRTLRATIEWSHELLSEDEQRLFARLSVFVGGCTLDAAEELAHADLDTLQSLLDKSLLRFSGERYWMLETIREYAADRLEADPRAAAELRLRHAHWHLALAEEIASVEAVEGNHDRLEEEHGNFRAALGALRETSDSASELRLVVPLARFWYGAGHLREGLMRLDDVLGRADTVPGRDKLLAHYYASAIALSRGDLDGAEEHSRAELQTKSCPGSARFRYMGARGARTRRTNARHARQRPGLLRGGTRTRPGSRRRGGRGRCDGRRGEVAFLEKDFDRAVELAQQSIDLAASAGWDGGEANGLTELAEARLAQGRIAEASAAVLGAAAVLERIPFPELPQPSSRLPARFSAPAETLSRRHTY